MPAKYHLVCRQSYMSGDGFSCSTSSPPIITENKSFQPMKKCETDDVKLTFR